MTVTENPKFLNTSVATYLSATDKVLQIGIANLLGDRSGLELVDSPDQASVTIIASDRLDHETIQKVRQAIMNSTQVVIVAGIIDDFGLLTAIESGASSVIARKDISSADLVDAVSAAHKGHGSLTPQLLGVLLSRLGVNERNFLRSSGKNLQGFTEREIDILKLLADGLDTAEIAHKLSYSERTVKKILHDVNTRFQLKNRCHAVAYALRNGVI